MDNEINVLIKALPLPLYKILSEHPNLENLLPDCLDRLQFTIASSNMLCPETENFRWLDSHEGEVWTHLIIFHNKYPFTLCF